MALISGAEARNRAARHQTMEISGPRRMGSPTQTGAAPIRRRISAPALTFPYTEIAPHRDSPTQRVPHTESAPYPEMAAELARSGSTSDAVVGASPPTKPTQNEAWSDERTRRMGRWRLRLPSLSFGEWYPAHGTLEPRPWRKSAPEEQLELISWGFSNPDTALLGLGDDPIAQGSFLPFMKDS